MLRAIAFVGTAASASFACSLLVDTSGLTGDGEGGGGASDARADTQAEATVSDGATGASSDGGPGADGGTDAACAFSNGALPVAVGSYCIDRTEATNADYDSFLAANVADPMARPAACAFATSFARKCSPLANGPGDPVSCIDWCDAYAYCQWAGKRLCGRIGGGDQAVTDQTNAATDQWYQACSRGGARAFPYGATYKPARCNDAARDAGQAVAVGSSAACAGGYDGVFDMSGNVHEWVDSCGATTGAGDKCIIRGGAYDDSADGVACALAFPLARNTANPTIGIRCCSKP